MEVISLAILGLIQGIVEFLPISSSGHLVLAKFLFGLENQLAGDGLLELWLHLGTFFSILFYFRRRLQGLTRDFFMGGEGRQMVFWLFIASLPVAITYAVGKEYFESTYLKPLWVGFFFLLNGGILFFGISRQERYSSQALCASLAFLIGLSQVLALFPGISRSGITVSCALILGFSLPIALEFSFLLLLPLLAGGILLKMKDFTNLIMGQAGFSYLVGFLMAFLGGLFAIHFMMKMVRHSHWQGFAWYCFALGFSFLLIYFVY